MNNDHHDRLKEATKTAHHQVEIQVGARALMQQPERESYLHLLQAHYGYIHWVQQCLQKSAYTIMDWEDLPKKKALASDILQLGGELPQKSSLVPVPTHAFTLGLCYVSEGASLGNRLMLKVLLENETFKSWEAHRFFAFEDPVYPERWKAFLREIAQLGEAGYPQLEQGARDGFDQFAQIHYQLSKVTTRL